MRPVLTLLTLILLSAGCAAPFGPFSAPVSAEQAHQPIPQVMMGALQEDLDLNEVQAAAILGNLAQETGNFTHLQQVGGPSYGYSQWLGSRKRAFFTFAKTSGGRRSFEANYGFLLHEITTEYGPMTIRMRATNTVDEVAHVFMREFLRPSKSHANLPARVRYAERYLAGDFTGAGCLGPEHLSGDRIRPCPAPVVAEVDAEAPPRIARLLSWARDPF